MNISIKIKRSKQWVAQQRLATGENTPDMLDVEVETADLSLEARKILLDYQSEYCSCDSLEYDREFRLRPRSYFGYEHFLIDSSSPSPKEISDAIVDAAARIARKVDEARRKKAETDARQEAERLEREEQERQLASARELLADEINQIKAERDECSRDRLTLAEFLAAVPEEYLNETLRIVAASKDEDEDHRITALRDTVENASPVVIFEDEDD